MSEWVSEWKGHLLSCSGQLKGEMGLFWCIYLTNNVKPCTTDPGYWVYNLSNLSAKTVSDWFWKSYSWEKCLNWIWKILSGGIRFKKKNWGRVFFVTSPIVQLHLCRPVPILSVFGWLHIAMHCLPYVYIRIGSFQLSQHLLTNFKFVQLWDQLLASYS